jgi:hypothetical protein
MVWRCCGPYVECLSHCRLACLQTAISKLAVGWLQRRFDALLQAGTLRLNMAYLGAGLVVSLLTGFGQIVDPVREWGIETYVHLDGSVIGCPIDREFRFD